MTLVTLNDSLTLRYRPTALWASYGRRVPFATRRYAKTEDSLTLLHEMLRERYRRRIKSKPQFDYFSARLAANTFNYCKVQPSP